MSVHAPVQSPPEPPPHEPEPSHKEAKANVRAAKAYAKAQRPWYKKKRFVVSGLIVALIAAASGSGGGDTESSDNVSSGGGDSNSASNGSGSSATAKNSDEGKSGKVGQALTNAGTTYKVTNAKATTTIGDPDLLGARADGMFVVVTLQLTNNKDETKTFLDSSSKIVTSDGKAYETSSKAIMAFGDESLMLKDIQPDLTTRGKLAFELPPNKVSGSTLVIEDLYGSGDIKVDLGF